MTLRLGRGSPWGLRQGSKGVSYGLRLFLSAAAAASSSGACSQSLLSSFGILCPFSRPCLFVPLLRYRRPIHTSFCVFSRRGQRPPLEAILPARFSLRLSFFSPLPTATFRLRFLIRIDRKIARAKMIPIDMLEIYDYTPIALNSYQRYRNLGLPAKLSCPLDLMTLLAELFYL